MGSLATVMKLLAVCLTALLTSSGCSSESQQAMTVNGPTTTTTKSGPLKAEVDKPLTRQQIDAALITADDLPAGFETAKLDRAEDSEDPSGCRSWDDLVAMLENAPTKAEAKHSRGAMGTTVYSTIAAQRQGTNKRFDTLAAETATCEVISDSSSTTRTVFKLAPLTLPKIGDDTFATRLTGMSLLGPVGIDVVVMRAGDNLVYVGNFDFNAPDAALTEAVARRAMEKVNASATGNQ